MKFTRIRIARFGPLADFDTGKDGSIPGLVAVLGPNEAGKSAFHQVLHSLVHGFYPANRDQNPFTPWGGGDIEIAGDLLLDDGEQWEVRRRLLSTPRGQLVRDATAETLDNRSLPCATHVDARVFSQVYAITLGDLARVEDAAWEAVQDEMVIGMGARDLRPPREAVRDLTEAAERLWRPDRRGKPRHRELRAALRDLRAKRAEAEHRDRDFRNIEARLEELSAREEHLRSIRTKAAEHIERLQDLLPLRNRLARLDELADTVGDTRHLDGLPRDAAARLSELEDRLRRARRAGEDLADIEGRLREAAGVLADEVPDEEKGLDAFSRPFLSLPLGRVRERVSALEEARRRHDDLREHVEGLKSRAPAASPRLPGWAMIIASLGVLLLALGLLTGSIGTGGVGAVLVSAGGAVLGRRWLGAARAQGQNDALQRDVDDLRRRAGEAERRLEQRRAAVMELLEPLSLRTSAVRRPSSDLVAELEGLIGLFRERERVRERVEGEDAETVEAELSELVGRLEEAGGGADPEGVEKVERRLRDLDHLERFREELIVDAGDLDDLRDRVREADGEGDEVWDRDRVASEKARLQDLERELRELREEAGELRGRLKGIQELETVDLLDGRILRAEDELHTVARARDRHFVLARLLERAETQFRAENQPDLLRRAEEHLAAFTGGRYRRLLFDGEGGSDGLRLHAEHLPGPVAVSAPLSTGTREQVYVALRLAIVDHLDEGRETLPLLLDEVLVNWDPVRRGEALDVLEGVSQRRQVFVFTCHPHFAEEIADRGGEVLSLAAPAAASTVGT